MRLFTGVGLHRLHMHRMQPPFGTRKGVVVRICGDDRVLGHLDTAAHVPVPSH